MTEGAPSDPAIGLSQIEAADPSFDLEVFRRQALETFMDVKSAIESRDLAGVEDVLSDTVYDDLEQDVESLLTRDAIEHFDGLVPSQAFVVAASHGPQGDAITLGIRAAAAQYLAPAGGTGAGAGVPGAFTEFWTFSRPPQAAARRRDECPTCGAPVSADTGRICHYCKTLLPPPAHTGWLVAAIRPAQENLG